MNADAIRRARLQAQMTQREFGILMGVSSRTISLWERGHREPTGEHVHAVKRVLKIAKQRIAMTPERIAGARKQLRMSRETFAALVGVTIYAVQCWELGKNKPGPHAQERMRRLVELNGAPLWDAVEMQRRIMRLEAEVYGGGNNELCARDDD